MNSKYDEIINLPHHVSQKHPPMPMQGRAAQFGSFAALKGHKEAVSDTEKTVAFDECDEEPFEDF